jgi:hypothetical protein
MQKIKKIFYIFCTIILGFLLQLLLHSGIEVLYLQNLESQGAEPVWTNYLGVKGMCALPMWSQWTLLLVGLIGGVWLGFMWWRIVYIEKRHWRFQKENKQ